MSSGSEGCKLSGEYEIENVISGLKYRSKEKW